MDFNISSNPENIVDASIGASGRELAFWIPDGVTWTQLNYGQGEGQVLIGDCEWGFYFAGNGELTVALHRGVVDVEKAVQFAHAVAKKMLHQPVYTITFRETWRDK